MWMKWFPWQFFIRKAARAEGFLDPVTVLAHFNRFGQPSEVMAPTELLRAGFVMHARGLLNSQAIQHNLDWIWPYWVEQQFNPRSPSFVPRAFSFTHINITHRNWTAVGTPGSPSLVLVDPRGLMTPFLDSWSIDTWFIGDAVEEIIPSRMEKFSQRLEMEDDLAVISEALSETGSVKNQVSVSMQGSRPVCHATISGGSREGGWLIVSIRPYNPEGVSFIHSIECADDLLSCVVDGKHRISWTEKADGFRVSQYGQGDVYNHIRENRRAPDTCKVHCKTGMATGAALFRVDPENTRELTVHIDATDPYHTKKNTKRTLVTPLSSWESAMRDTCDVTLDDTDFQRLFNSAKRTVILHASDDLYAGPYTYRRFWFRDASLIVHTMVTCGMIDSARKVIDSFLSRQTSSGHFLSQEGEWDSNGQVLWVMGRYCEITKSTPPEEWVKAVRKAVSWIIKMRLKDTGAHLHDGLLPPGFSAEHLGPNDYYYWDNFWAVAGLRKAALLLHRANLHDEADSVAATAEEYLTCIERSLTSVTFQLGTRAMPASPYRRLDSGAVGSLCAGFPLGLWAADDPRLMETVNYLFEKCMVNDALFHDISHAGINPYLTLHCAQVLLRAQDKRFLKLMKSISHYASPTGQWPEAIHPVTGAGCMGDGQHVWAAAEWMNMVFRCFVDEELSERKLILCRGVDSAWYQSATGARFGPAWTSFGPVTLTIHRVEGDVQVEWDAAWTNEPSSIEIMLPYYERASMNPFGHTHVRLRAQENEA